MKTLETKTKKGTKVKLETNKKGEKFVSVPKFDIKEKKFMGLSQARQDGETITIKVINAGHYNGQKVLIAATDEMKKFVEEANQTKKEYEENLLKVTVTGWEAHSIKVDSRLSDDEIIENHRGFIEGLNFKDNEKEFRKALKKAREEEKEKEEARKERESERQEKIEQAKKSGEKVEMQNFMAPCNDPQEECSWDHVTEYAFPDGSTKFERVHTY